MAIEYDNDFFLDSNDVSNELQKLTKLEIKKFLERLHILEYNILNFFLKYPGKTVYTYCQDEYYKSTGTTSTVYRYTKEMANDGLLEIISEIPRTKMGKIDNQPNPYRLTLNGLFHIILDTVDSRFFCYVIKNIVVNYKENPLYRIFLYPVIKEKTINKICDDFLFCSLVLEYLRNVCKDVVNLLKWLNNEGKMVASSDGYFMNQVFFWDTATKENDNEGVRMKVRFFLRDILGWKNTQQLKINVRNYENLVEIYDISNPSRNSFISIPENEGKAVFRQNGKKIYEFEVMKHQGFLSIEVKTDKKLIEKIIFPFLERHNVYLIDFLTLLRTRLIKSTTLYGNYTFKALSKDPNYKKALEWLDKELDLR